VPSQGSTRDSSPHLSSAGSSAGGNPTSKGASAALGSSRSTTYSPRQTSGLGSSNSRYGQNLPGSSHKAGRVLGSSGSEGGPYSASLMARTSAAVLRVNSPGKPERLDSLGARQQQQQATPGGDGEFPCARIQSAQSHRQHSVDAFHTDQTPNSLVPDGSARSGGLDFGQVGPVSARPESATARAFFFNTPGKGTGQTAEAQCRCGIVQAVCGACGQGYAQRQQHHAIAAAPHAQALGQHQAVAVPYTLAAGGDVSPEVWVTKWVDYSSKYGVGYLLSDGSLGVYFNDSTKVILVGSRFDYVTRRTQDKPEVRATYSLDDYPEDLKKKVTLLRHFKNYLASDTVEKKDGATVGESGLPSEQRQPPPAGGPPAAAYVKKWTRNKHAILFQLSNKIVQVMFFDKTEALLSSKSQIVTYVDKKGQVCEYPLSSALDVPNAELSKRLRYTRDILVNLLGVRTSDLPVA